MKSLMKSQLLCLFLLFTSDLEKYWCNDMVIKASNERQKSIDEC